MSKAEKKREQRLNRDNVMDDLFNFGNYMMRDESGEALSSSKKRYDIECVESFNSSSFKLFSYTNFYFL